MEYDGVSHRFGQACLASNHASESICNNAPCNEPPLRAIGYTKNSDHAGVSVSLYKQLALEPPIDPRLPRRKGHF
eukprot:508900-Pyramimonas_sp.AAC.1